MALASCSPESGAEVAGEPVSTSENTALASNPFGSEAWWSEADVEDRLDRYPDRCVVHEMAMVRDTVENFDGTVLFGTLLGMGLDVTKYCAARETSFPNANSYADYDYGARHVAAIVRYCPSCREAEGLWITQHKDA